MADRRRSQEAARIADLSEPGSSPIATRGSFPPREESPAEKRKLFESWLSSVSPKAPPSRAKPRVAAPIQALQSMADEDAPDELAVDGDSTQIYQQVPADLLRRAQANRSEPPPPTSRTERGMPTDERTAVFRVPPELLALSIQSMNEQGAGVASAAAEPRSAFRPDPDAAKLFSDEEHTKVTPMSWPRGHDGEPLALPAIAELLAARAPAESVTNEVEAASDLDAADASDGELETSDSSEDEAGQYEDEEPSEEVSSLRSPWPRRAAWLVVAVLAVGAMLSLGGATSHDGQSWVKRVGTLVTR